MRKSTCQHERSRRVPRWLTGLCVSVVTAFAATAQAAEDGAGWLELPGSLADIAMNDDARAYAVSRTGEALRWRAADQRWSRMSGKFVRITGAEGNHPWALAENGTVSRFNGLWWEAKGHDVQDVAGDASGNVVTAKRDGKLQKWEPLSSSWRDISFQGRAKRVALDDAGRPWVIGADDRISHLTDKGWQSLPGGARDIAVGGNGAAVIADLEGKVRTWNATDKRWEVAAGVLEAVAVAATPGGKPWVLVAEGRLVVSQRIERTDAPEEAEPQAQNPQARSVQAPGTKAPSANAPVVHANVERATTPNAPQARATTASPGNGGGGGVSLQGSESKSGRRRSGSSDPAATTSGEALVFTDTLAKAAHVEVGKDGSVFVLMTGGGIARWSNERRRLETFPGQLARIAVDMDGHPWGVTSLGRVFRHNGQNWKQIAGATASDIAIGADGTVVTADADGILAKLNRETGRFEHLDGRGVQVAVAPDGTPWTIRADGIVQRCDTPKCTAVDRMARNISIGPDGSVFIVTTQNQLQRALPGTDTFERVLVPGHTPADVGAGPNGFPWVVTADGTLLASKFFERDESEDRKVALGTSSATTGTGSTAQVVSAQNASGFKFTKNLRFDSFSSSDAGLAALGGIFVGQDNSVFITDGGSILEFNERTEKFESLDATFPASVGEASTDVDGVIWALNASNATVYRMKGTQVKTYVITSGPGTTPRNMAVAGDGTVYVAIGESIWIKGPNDSKFTRSQDFDNVYNVAIAGAGDVWIINQSFEVQQWTGSKFEDRPKGKVQKASSIAASADGTVYVSYNSEILRWNGTNGDFDAVNPTNIGSTLNKVALTNEGRPWAANTSSAGDDIFRARE